MNAVEIEQEFFCTDRVSRTDPSCWNTGRSVRSSGSGTGAEGGGWQPWAEAELLMRHGGAATPPTANEEPLIPLFSSSGAAVEQQRSLPPSTEPGKPAGLPPSARCCLSACLSSSVLQCRASWLDICLLVLVCCCF